jgi:hypothetical protein
LEYRLMDVGALASGFVAAQMGQVQLAAAAKMLKTDSDNAQSVAKLLDAAQDNANRLTSAAAGIGTNLDITV